MRISDKIAESHCAIFIADHGQKKTMEFWKNAHFHPPAARPCLPIAVAWAPTCALPVVALDPSRSIVHVRMGTPKVAKLPYENYFPLYWRS